MKGSGQRYLLEIRGECGERIPELTRLRGILKSLLRAYSFRVVKLVPVDETEQQSGIEGGCDESM